MLLKRLFEKLLQGKEKLQEPDVVALSREKIIFSRELSKWIHMNNCCTLLLDKDVLDFLKANSIDFDYTFGTLIVVWGTWIIIGHTYADDGRFAIINEFITTSPHHGVVYKNESTRNDARPVKIFKLEDVQ